MQDDRDYPVMDYPPQEYTGRELRTHRSPAAVWLWLCTAALVWAAVLAELAR